MAHTHAFCFADGIIRFGSPVPDGALSFVDGIESDLHRAIHGTARLAYDGETWLVPGVPEARDQGEKVEALMRYRDRVRACLFSIEAEDEADG